MVRKSSDKKTLKGGLPFNLALNLIKSKSGLIASALKKEAKQMAKDEIKTQIKTQITGGCGTRDQNNLFGGKAHKKTKDACLCQGKCGGKVHKKQMGGQGKCGGKVHKKQMGGQGKCGGKVHKKQMGGEFDIHLKVNQEFGKTLDKKFKEGVDKIKKQQRQNKLDMEKIIKFKEQIKVQPLKTFGNLKTKTQEQSKKDMIQKQDKKIEEKKQVQLKLLKDIKKLEEKIYGNYR